MTVNLSKVVSVSHSYVDEFFGVLTAVKDWDWFTKNVHLKDVNEHVLRVIAEAIDRQLKETGQQIAKSA